MSSEPFKTPPRRRKSIHLGSPALNVSSDNMLLDNNDDAKEKRARRKSQLLTNNVSSPGGVPASPGRVNVAADREKRKSVAPASGMTNEQVKAHYASCIKLSSENKINVKNAFALHLIDYMKDLLQESQSVESGTNFQVASCTLDAGVKIYSYRVDSVHKETFKVLGSLGGATDNKDDEEEAEDGGADGEGITDSQKAKPMKKRKKMTIEKNLNKITSEQFDLDFEVDPYFHKTSSAFDEGGVKGLLLLQVQTGSDVNNLRMDSDTLIKDVEAPAESEELPESVTYNIDFFSGSYTCNTEADICPSLKRFQLCNWDKSQPNNFEETFDDNAHKFDVNAPVIQPDMTDMGMDADYGGGGDDFSDNEDQNDEGIGPIEFDAREAHYASQNGNLSLMNLTGASTMPLEIFPLQTSEYSFFRKDILDMWRGPHHWKHAGQRHTGKDLTKDKKSKGKKEPFRIDFDDDSKDIKKLLSSGRAHTYLREATLKKHTLQMTTLPPKVLYAVEKLFQMFLQENVIIQQQKVAPLSNLENENETLYNYENKNDLEGFCPNIVEGGDDYDDDFDDVGGGDGSFDDASQPPMMHDNQTLIAPPTKVLRLDINYAKSAKRIDIKKLKTAMWNMLTITETEPDKENVDVSNLPRPDINQEEETDSSKALVSGQYTFKTMYGDLPSKITTNMAQNLSGPISFVCLLYLANEKNLALKSTEKMDDIRIASNLTKAVPVEL